MNLDSVISFMNQQTKPLKELEELIAHNEKQIDPGHSVKPENIETLKTYVETMKTAVNTAATLAKYYKSAEAPRKAQEPSAPEEPPKDETPAVEPAPEDLADEFDFLS